jgi:hypothetical protein
MKGENPTAIPPTLESDDLLAENRPDPFAGPEFEIRCEHACLPA